MKNLFVIFLFIGLLGCSKNFKQPSNSNPILNDTVRIVNEDIDYEIIILEPGFNSWLIANARSRDYYGQDYLEARNRVWVAEYNNRHRQPFAYNPNLYPLEIHYDAQTDYGYEVNYMLYHYLVYFQVKYNQKLGGFVPRI